MPESLMAVPPGFACRRAPGVFRRERTDRRDHGQPEPELHTEAHDPAVPAAYSSFMRQGWGDRELDLPPHPIAPYAAARRQRLAEAFPGERLVLPAGTFKVRSYDTDYRFRSDTAHTYFCGNQTSDAVLVIDDGESVLYARPRSERNTDEFFRDRQYGELWVGRRPSLKEISDSLGLEVRHIDQLGGRPRHVRQDPRPPRCLRGRRPAGRRRREPRHRLRPRRLRDAAGQGRVGGRRAPDGLRHHRPRVHRRRRRDGPGRGVRRALDRGHVLPPGPGRWATTSATTRSSAAAPTPRRCTGSTTPGAIVPGRAGAARHGRRGPQPLHRRRHPHPADRRHLHLAAARALRPRVRRAGGRHQRGAAGCAVPRRTPRRHGRPRPRPRVAEAAPGLGGGGARPRVEGLRPVDAARRQPHARHGRARLRPGLARTSTPRASSPRAWC